MDTFHCSIRGISQVAISGGCWQSRYLLSTLSDKFKLLGIELLVPYQLPFNDECISFGASVVWCAKLCKRIIMCLAVPTQIIKLLDNQMALTSLSGVEKEVSLALFTRRSKRR